MILESVSNDILYYNIILRNLALFRPRPKLCASYSTIILRDLAKNNAVEFSVQMMQLARF